MKQNPVQRQDHQKQSEKKRPDFQVMNVDLEMSAQRLVLPREHYNNFLVGPSLVLAEIHAEFGDKARRTYIRVVCSKELFAGIVCSRSLPISALSPRQPDEPSRNGPLPLNPAIYMVPKSWQCGPKTLYKHA